MSPHAQPRRSRARLLAWVALALMGLLAVSLLDPWLWKALRIDPQKSLERKDWWQLLRQFGTLPFWAILGACVWLADRRAERLARATPTRASGRGIMIFLSPLLSGAFAELLKLLVRRGRPVGDGTYRFGWIEHVDGRGLASSHAAVAFGGAMITGWLFPALRVPLLLLACGTSITRLAVGAHYASDVCVAAALSYAALVLTRRIFPTHRVEPGSVQTP